MAPTGVALRDIRTRLFAAAERVLLRDGPAALTSRAVTTEAECAKGVLHRHFDDFDAFLAEFVRDRIARLDHQITELDARAGHGTVTANLTEALLGLFDSVVVAIVPLITFRDELRARLRRTWPAGVPVLTQGAIMLAGYLEAERELGRVVDDADADVLAATLVGSAHLLYADRDAAPPTAEAVHRTVVTVVTAALRGT